MSKMLLNSALWCRVRGQHISGIVAYSNGSTKYLVLQKPYPARFYAKGKDTCSECCREPTAQTKGRRVENWPKPIDPLHPPWKADCSTAPPPPNNDPYRIKVPEIVVPPLPATNVKEMCNKEKSQLFGRPEIPGRVIQDLFHNSAIVHPDYWKEKPERSDSEGSFGAGSTRLGYHGRAKYQYAFHEPWKPLDRLALLAQAEQEEENKGNQIADDIVESYKNPDL